MTHAVLLALVGFAGGALGSMIGLGGGVFIIPVLTLFLKVPIHSAVSASMFAVVATSCTAASAYLRDGLTNVRLGLTLETFTVSGAFVGSLVGTSLSGGVLSAVFGGTMVLVALYMVFRPRSEVSPENEPESPSRLGGAYYDRSLDAVVTYEVHRVPAGLAASLVAGGVSGLLGVGGGFLKVPVMVLAMRVPVRAATTTSSFMVGVTAAAGAMVYLARGLVDPLTTVPVVLGVTVGAYLGSRLARRVRSTVLASLFAVVLFALAVQMIVGAARIEAG